MTVAEMIEWLKTMPQDARVVVLERLEGSGWYDQGGVDTITFEPTGIYPTFELFDYTSDYFKDESYYNTKELVLGVQ